jgi:hypothetical protein
MIFMDLVPRSSFLRSTFHGTDVWVVIHGLELFFSDLEQVELFQTWPKNPFSHL